MKPVLSICVILILLQTLLFGSLVKIEFPDTYQAQWGETLIHQHIVLDPFLTPGKDGFNQNFQNKNEWVPFHFSKNFINRNTSALPLVSEFLFKTGTKHANTAVPVFILNGTLRI